MAVLPWAKGAAACLGSQVEFMVCVPSSSSAGKPPGGNCRMKLELVCLCVVRVPSPSLSTNVGHLRGDAQ